jgi:hypothetical protein
MAFMNKTRTLIFGSLVAVAMLFGVVLGATVLAKSSLTPASAAAAAASPAPTFRSNEDPTHEKGETAAQEAAENSGQRPFGGGAGHSNEDPTHEKGETAAREAAENAAAKVSPTP